MSVKRKSNRIYKAFINGTKQVAKGKFKKCQADLIKVLNLSDTCRSSFDSRSKGRRGHTPLEVEAIENVFKKYGVTDNIWSDPIPVLRKYKTKQK